MFSGLFGLSERFFCICNHFYAWILFNCIYANMETLHHSRGQKKRYAIMVKNCFMISFFHVNSAKTLLWSFLGRFGASEGWALIWGVPRRLHMVPTFSMLAHTSFLYNWIIFGHKSGYKCRKISCSVKIIMKTSILSDFDPFMGSQQFLCTHKSQILFTNVQ